MSYDFIKTQTHEKREIQLKNFQRFSTSRLRKIQLSCAYLKILKHLQDNLMGLKNKAVLLKACFISKRMC